MQTELGNLVVNDTVIESIGETDTSHAGSSSSSSECTSSSSSDITESEDHAISLEDEIVHLEANNIEDEEAMDNEEDDEGDPTQGGRSSRGKWTANEDETLRNAVQTHGGRNWKRISEFLEGRTDVQCLHRWQKVLRPGLIKGPWTKEVRYDYRYYFYFYLLD
jgi:hypothetical protein